MNHSSFQHQYELAIQKVAIGYYIMDTAGAELDYSSDLIATNKRQLCGILSKGINISIDSIDEDACLIYHNMSGQFIYDLQESGLLEELVGELHQLKLI